jgi:uncharacterized membrane protein
MSPFDLAGLVGVVVILGGYGAATLGKLRSDGAASLALNLAGASLILLSLTRAFNLSAALVEGAWALIALAGLIRLALKRLRRH